MNSVRQRLERESETPEVEVPTSDRRVALAAGGSVSTRQTQERRNDAANPEVTVHREVTSSASVQYEVGGFSRVRDRLSVAAEATAAKPQPRPDSAASSWEAMYKRWDDEAKASEQAKVAARQKREADEHASAKSRRQAAEKQQKRAQHDFAEKAVIHEASDLDENEKQLFWTKLVAMNACLDAGAASIVAESIRSSRTV